jgi:amidohydrolase
MVVSWRLRGHRFCYSLTCPTNRYVNGIDDENSKNPLDWAPDSLPGALPVVCLSLGQQALAQEEIPLESIDSLSAAVSSRVVAWRRDFHQNPELSNREFRTAGIVAEHLAGLGMEVQTGVAHTGVVGLLKGGKPGPVVLLRADMDGLPVPERNDLPFRSTAVGEYNGEEVPVMHACGHDSHVAILMGVAEILAEMRDELPGTVKFVFQPAEEGAPKGEEGGAELMVAEGVLENPAVDAAFALHVSAVHEAGRIGFAAGPRYASVDDFKIVVHGVQAHGASPWMGVDSVVVSAQIINALQTIVSRNLELIEQPGIVTIGSIHGGLRSNIIPEQVEMVGTIRALNDECASRFTGAFARSRPGWRSPWARPRTCTSPGRAPIPSPITTRPWPPRCGRCSKRSPDPAGWNR